MTALKVLQFGPTGWRGGVASAITDLCLGLSQEGHEVTLACNGGEVLSRLDGTGVRILEGRSFGLGPALFRNVLPMRNVLRSFRPDIVHVHGRGASLVSLLSGRYPDCFTLHSSILTDQVSAFDTGVIRRFLSPMGRKVIVLSDLARPYCRDRLGVADENLFTVPNGVDVNRFKPCDPATRDRLRAEFNVGQDEVLVLFVGRLEQEKQPNLVVDLAAAMRSRGDTKTRFMIIGDGTLKEAIAASILKQGLEDRVTLLGFQHPLIAYQAADLLVMPSLYEGFGLVAAEAMAAGCAVLRSRTGGHADMIEEGETGYVCESDSADFIKTAMSILDAPEDLARVAANARTKAVKDLSLEASVRATTAVYRAALAHRGLQ